MHHYAGSAVLLNEGIATYKFILSVNYEPKILDARHELYIPER
jgi:hypothetical protein